MSLHAGLPLWDPHWVIWTSFLLSVCREVLGTNDRIGDWRSPIGLLPTPLKLKERDFLRVLRLHLSVQGLWVQCLVGELRSHMLFSSVQFSSVAQSCPTLCNPMNRSAPGLPVHHQLLEFTQTHVHRVGDAIQPSHPLSSPPLPAPNPSQNQGLFQWVNSSHQVAKVLEFQLQHQSFQWTPRTDLL